ncbi:hypothetical protein ACO0QE_001609 [Hanseniaspora vineae]
MPERECRLPKKSSSIDFLKKSTIKENSFKAHCYSSDTINLFFCVTLQNKVVIKSLDISEMYIQAAEPNSIYAALAEDKAVKAKSDFKESITSSLYWILAIVTALEEMGYEQLHLPIYHKDGVFVYVYLEHLLIASKIEENANDFQAQLRQYFNLETPKPFQKIGINQYEFSDFVIRYYYGAYMDSSMSYAHSFEKLPIGYSECLMYTPAYPMADFNQQEISMWEQKHAASKLISINISWTTNSLFYCIYTFVFKHRYSKTVFI